MKMKRSTTVATLIALALALLVIVPVLMIPAFAEDAGTPEHFDVAAYREMIAPVEGGSIRLSHAAGIRYATQLDLDKMGELLAMKEEGMISDVSFGTVIAPRSYVEAAGAFTMEALDENLNISGSKYLNVKGTIGYYYGRPEGVTLDKGFDTCFVGSISNVKLGNRA